LALILFLAPFCVAWDGSVSGSVTVKTTDVMRVGAASIEGGASVGQTVQAVFNLHQPGGYGGVLTLTLPSLYIDDVVDLPHRAVRLQYTVYDEDGSEVFSGRDARRGEVVLESTPAGLLVLIDVEMLSSDRSGESVALANLQAQIVEVSAPPVPSHSTYPHDPYYDPYYDEPDVYVEVHPGASSGCDSDDWEDDGWAEDSSDYDSGGCAGDDFDSSSSAGGCAGDDIGDGGGAALEGCEGDAIAASGRPARKSPTIVRLVNLTPWLFAFLAIRVLRRRPF